ncbi:hypothetical protein KAR91_86905, partial [Candidatus Pacearchaeota archaeon]|nr:hypothetical protein [Candidatus Pacearchaeota archaeon]
MQKMLWIDVETTGLSPEDNDLLEVAAVLTDSKGEIFGECFQGVIRSDKVSKLRFDDFTTKMHTKNGLIAELALADLVEERTITALGTKQYIHYVRLNTSVAVAHSFNEWYTRTIRSLYRDKKPPNRGLPLAGSNPGFDRKWIEFYMPEIAKNIHYRSFDMNTLYYFFESIKGKN